MGLTTGTVSAPPLPLREESQGRLDGTWHDGAECLFYPRCLSTLYTGQGAGKSDLAHQQLRKRVEMEVYRMRWRGRWD